MKTFKQIYQELNYRTEMVAAILPAVTRVAVPLLKAAAKNPHVQAAAIDGAAKVGGLLKKKLPPKLPPTEEEEV
jgi:hypothetical protein